METWCVKVMVRFWNRYCFVILNARLMNVKRNEMNLWMFIFAVAGRSVRAPAVRPIQFQFLPRPTEYVMLCLGFFSSPSPFRRIFTLCVHLVTRCCVRFTVPRIQTCYISILIGWETDHLSAFLSIQRPVTHPLTCFYLECRGLIQHCVCYLTT